MLSKISSALSFFANSFSGQLPTELGKLLMLESTFDGHGCEFTGTVPTELGSLASLKEKFSLSNNKFKGLLPSQLGLLSLMTEYFVPVYVVLISFCLNKFQGSCVQYKVVWSLMILDSHRESGGSDSRLLKFCAFVFDLHIFP